MDAKMVKEIRKHIQNKSTEELLFIWRKHDEMTYSEEGLEAIRQLLAERGITDFSIVTTKPKSFSALTEYPVKNDLVEDLLGESNIDRELRQYLSLPEGKKIMADKYKRHMLFGFLWASGGTAVTVFTYNAATSSSSGGTYIVAWGAILFGVIDFFRGLSEWLKYRD